MKKKLLIFVILSMLMLSSVTALYWTSVWDSDPADGKNDFNPNNNEYYISSSEQWYWCNNELLMTTRSDTENVWGVVNCDDKCHEFRTWSDSGQDEFVDGAFCGVTTVENWLEDCTYPYGGDAFCGDDYGLDDDKYYRGYCDYYTLGANNGGECINCREYLDSVSCDSLDFKWCVYEKTTINSLGDEAIYYFCDFIDAAQYDTGCPDETLKEWDGNLFKLPAEDVENLCLDYAANLEEKDKAWHFDSSDCGCEYRGSYTSDLLQPSYPTADDCRIANSEKIDEFLETGTCEGGLLDIPGWAIILIIIALILFVIWILGKKR